MRDTPSIFGIHDPMQGVRDWMAQAAESEPSDPNAMALATVDADGMPDVRIVLLKEIEDDGFVFYTNHDSRKGRQIAATPKAAFAIHWKTTKRQVRVQGEVRPVTDAQSDAYYASRDLGSRLGAWASEQSRPLQSREALLSRVEAARERYGPNPPRPPHWGGLRVRPLRIEFWSDGEHRLHDREAWERAYPDGLRDDTQRLWTRTRLFP